MRSTPPSRTPMRRSCAAGAIARYEVGAVKSTVARCATSASSSSFGPAFSSSTVEAPTCIGNSVSPPRPKVKASGGLPMKTSFSSARSTCSGKQTQLAITSRWKCIVAFGWPVVPEVKASRQVSSAAVSTLANGASWRAISASRPSGVGSPKQTTRCSTGVTGSSISSSPRSFWSQSAKSTWPFSTICFSSLARSIGMVATAMPPAFITANQQATSIGLLAERSSTRLPGTRPQSFTSTWAMRSAWRCSSA